MMNPETNASRIIHHGDGIDWLRNASLTSRVAIVTSLPDVSEIPELGCRKRSRSGRHWRRKVAQARRKGTPARGWPRQGGLGLGRFGDFAAEQNSDGPKGRRVVAGHPDSHGDGDGEKRANDAPEPTPQKNTY